MNEKRAEKRALLEAVYAAPEDFAPRLAFADWCAKNKEQDRARFIRLQCQIADHVEGDFHCQQWTSEANSLFYRFGRRWLDKRPRTGVEWRFQRGFPGHSFRIRAVSAHHGRSLARWDQLDVAGNVVAPGISFATTTNDGRIQTVNGFFGDLEHLLA